MKCRRAEGSGAEAGKPCKGPKREFLRERLEREDCSPVVVMVSNTLPKVVPDCRVVGAGAGAKRRNTHVKSFSTKSFAICTWRNPFESIASLMIDTPKKKKDGRL